jgi:hypothetical protein
MNTTFINYMVFLNLMAENLTYIIKKTIDQDSIVRQGLARNLISPRALASHIMKSNPELNLNVEALRTAIRRMDADFEGIESNYNRINKFIKDAKIHLKSGIVRVAFQKGDASLELINRSFKAMEIYGGDTFRVTKGQKILHILVDEENLGRIKDVFKERVLDIEGDVCELTVILSDEAYPQHGMWATFINEIALNGISLVDAFSCGTEISIFVKEADSQKAFNVLKDKITRAKKEFKEKDKGKK